MAASGTNLVSIDYHYGSTEALLNAAMIQAIEEWGAEIERALATVLRANDILILENGQIREYGEREALRNDPHSRFAELLRTGMEEVLA